MLVTSFFDHKVNGLQIPNALDHITVYKFTGGDKIYMLHSQLHSQCTCESMKHTMHSELLQMNAIMGNLIQCKPATYLTSLMGKCFPVNIGKSYVKEVCAVLHSEASCQLMVKKFVME